MDYWCHFISLLTQKTIKKYESTKTDKITALLVPLTTTPLAYPFSLTKKLLQRRIFIITFNFNKLVLVGCVAAWWYIYVAEYTFNIHYPWGICSKLTKIYDYEAKRVVTICRYISIGMFSTKNTFSAVKKLKKKMEDEKIPTQIRNN